jgi:hypothetical protein
VRTTASRLTRRSTVLPALVLALVASACTTRNVASVPEGDVPTPDETPIVEPVSPPATDVDRPDEEGPEDGVPEDNDLGSDDGEQ